MNLRVLKVGSASESSEGALKKIQMEHGSHPRLNQSEPLSVRAGMTNSGATLMAWKEESIFQTSTNGAVLTGKGEFLTEIYHG